MQDNTASNTKKEVEVQVYPYPDAAHPFRTTARIQEQHRKKVPDDFVWNNRDVTAYTNLDLRPPERLNMFQNRFLSRVDVSKGPIETTVMSLVRLNAPDHENNQGVKTPPRKEWLYYTERWEGNDWRGLRILNPVSGHIEGMYTK
jgi:hypothetical protein